MKDINDFYDLINENFDGSFNRDIIINNRQSENLVDFLDKVGKSLEILEYIKYNGYELIEDEGLFDVHDICARSYDAIPEKTIQLVESRLSLIKLKYTIDFENQKRYMEMKILIPKPYMKNYFYINGNKIYPIYQIVDSSTYIMKNALVLKTTMMPLRIKANIVSLKDIYNISYTARNFTVSLYKDIPLVAYYLAIVGFSKAMDYLIGDNVVTIINKTDENKYNNLNTITFVLGDNLLLIVDRVVFNDQEYVRSVVSSLIYTVDTYCPDIVYRNINSISYWRNILGMMIYTKVNKMRGKSLLVLFERVFDDITRSVLKIDEEHKKHTYAVVKWLTFNFDALMEKDNLSMDNKRLRLSEYMVIPVNSRFSHIIRRLLDSKKKLKIDKIVSAFNINPMIIIDAMVNSKNKAGINKLTRFCNTVNDMDLISALKFSLTGPQSIGSGSNNSIPDSHRYLHPSHIGKVDILASSAGSPGTSGSLLPMGKLYGMYFSDKPEPQDAEDIYKEYLSNRPKIIESMYNIPIMDVTKVRNQESGHIICTRNLSMYNEANIGIDAPFIDDMVDKDENIGIYVVKQDTGNPNVE